MKIYTKTGDQGETGLFGADRVDKDSLRVHLIGEVDELNAHLGLCRAQMEAALVDEKESALAEIEELLQELQMELFDLGADLATPLDAEVEVRRIDEEDISQLEKWIDEMDRRVPRLKNFILPGGGELGAQLHIARAVCRRAERFAVALSGTQDIGEHILVYLNRFSDLMFVTARFVNNELSAPEEKWA